MNNLYGKIIAAILIVVIAAGLVGIGFYAGMQHVEVKIEHADVKQQAKQQLAASNVQTASVRREIVYRDRIKLVESVHENCLDSSPGPDIVRVYNEVRSGEERPLFDFRLFPSGPAKPEAAGTVD